VIDEILGNLSCAPVWRSPGPVFLGLFTELSTEIVHAFSGHAPERGARFLRIRCGPLLEPAKIYFDQIFARGEC